MICVKTPSNRTTTVSNDTILVPVKKSFGFSDFKRKRIDDNFLIEERILCLFQGHRVADVLHQSQLSKMSDNVLNQVLTLSEIQGIITEFNLKFDNGCL